MLKTNSVRFYQRMVRKPMPLRRASFFKVMIGDFTQKLRIPPAFVRHFNGKLLNKSILKNPTGKFWHVKVERIGNDLFFQEGWQNFVKDNSLQTGDFLVLEYDGNSEFDVLIFGKSGCEKEDALTDMNWGGHCPNKLEEIREERVMGSPLCKISHYSPNKFEELQNGRSFGSPLCKCSYYNGCSKMNSVLSGKTNRRGKLMVRVLTCQLKLEKPHFSITWSRTRNRSYVTIPKLLARDIRNRSKPTLTLVDPSGRRWQITTNNRGDGRMDLGAGWTALRKGNNIREGDICAFEFIQGRGRGSRSFIQLHIVRAAE
ncbi:putative B3 domain-containing protein Os03g0621600 isoform X2 [Tasmannia lanceolata]|uniref:putative B3 domain-containing protein Os03g0621600 isoform X2 n=1 Tax=Tasmannia lanceolata TaxID=3420 RepID=UPI0040630221